MVQDHPDFDFDQYLIPARICLGIAICGGALLAVAMTSIYFLKGRLSWGVMFTARNIDDRS